MSTRQPTPALKHVITKRNVFGALKMPDFSVHFSAPPGHGQPRPVHRFAPVSVSFYTGGFQRLSNKALLTTLTELSAMAAPASTGLR
jgi:hypothetical protein